MKQCVVCKSKHEREQPTCSRSCAARNRTYKERECKFPTCSVVFTPNSPSPFCSPTHQINCEECDVKIEVRSEPRFAHLCHECAVKIGAEKAKKTRLEKYGVEHHFASKEIQAKIKATNIERYGVENPAQAEEIQAKIAETNIERYGGVAPIHSEKVKEKWRKTNLERYGTIHSIASEETKRKIRETNLERYGVEYALSLPEIREQIARTNLDRYGVENVFAAKEIQDKISQIMQARLDANQGVIPRISKRNQEFARKLEERFSGKVYFEKSFNKYSADLAIENTLIEINPTVSHNSHISFLCLIKGCDIPCSKHKQITQTYHYDRAKAALDEDVTLVQVYDWDDEDRIMNMLAGKVEKGWQKHSARKLEKVKLTTKEANLFMRDNHIQGAVRSQTHCYGLKTQEGELVAAATFGKARFGAKADYEWLRYAVKRQHIVHGASNALWRMFLADTSASTVISYIDFNHTTREKIFLNSCKFEEQKCTGPQLAWHNIKTNQMIRETALLKLGADRLLKTAYGSRETSGLNNHDIMLLEGFLPVYTAGNRVFLWRR